LRDARGLRGDADAPAVQRRKRHLVAFSFVADAIRNRHCAIREDKFAAGRGADPQFFLFLADLNPGVPFSTTNAVMPFSPFAGSVFTYAIAASAAPPL